ncbi:hypothetical protein K435DRAFT_31519 [Dendrothele bispora CBS 962.96]|uniref:Uncharacterized protein n=1 Tax=Dendrothele bispora (strain CBS 962.96) TaxID=1314807 RepID=A0A4S8M7Q5_DENBC|nr:hypothetical protein K435DRAFT_31519 [Dendrothele bispora CBS 962.96]
MNGATEPGRRHCIVRQAEKVTRVGPAFSCHIWIFHLRSNFLRPVAYGPHRFFRPCQDQCQTYIVISLQHNVIRLLEHLSTHKLLYAVSWLTAVQSPPIFFCLCAFYRIRKI